MVVGILCSEEKKEILIALRPSHVLYPNLWEFPGGKIEPGESSYEAVTRELAEEIGIQLTSAHIFTTLTHEYPDRTVHLEVWWVDTYEGEPHGKEGQEVKWFPYEKLSSLTFPEGNKLIIEAITRRLG